jgi:hypothetical protein
LFSVVAVIGLMSFVFLGVALTIGAMLLVAVPIVIGFAVVGALFGRRP